MSFFCHFDWLLVVVDVILVLCIVKFYYKCWAVVAVVTFNIVAAAVVIV